MFKKLTSYKLTSTIPDLLTMEKALQCTPFAPTTGQQEKSTGWVPPRADGGIFVESVNGHWMLRFMAETRRASGQAKLTEEQVREIRASQKTNRQLAAEYGINPSRINGIRLDRMWKDFSNPFAGLMGI